jgi:ABC-type amino acid transport substrate-binding protein
MRRRAVVAIVVVAAVLALTLPAAAAQPTPGLPATLRVLVASDEMPEMFSFAEKGQPGFERELMEGFCRIHGLKLEVVPVRDFDRIVPMLQAGEGDVITGIVDTPARRQKVAFTSEVFPVRHLAVTRRPLGAWSGPSWAPPRRRPSRFVPGTPASARRSTATCRACARRGRR